MMKRILPQWFVLVLALLLVATGVDAQKVDQRLTRLVEQVAAARSQSGQPSHPKTSNKQIVVYYNADGSIKALSAIATLEKGAECPTALLEQMGIQVRWILGDMVSLLIPADKLSALEQVDAFSYVRADQYNQLQNQEARKTTGVEQVNTSAAAQAQGLPKAFTGEGVVVGVIDNGIDFNHAAFCHPNGATRIKKAIILKDDQLVEYGEKDIPALTTDNDESHGTHTSATAGGSDTGNGQQGVAPQAELFLCGLRDVLSDNNLILCMKKIFEYADQVGKPAVINMSIGTPLGFHDGSDAVGKAIVTLTENGTKPGCAVVVSSGNAAENSQSIVKTLSATSDQLKTVLGASEITEEKAVKYSCNYFVYASDFKDFSCELKLVDITTGKLEDVGTHMLTSDGKTYTPKLDKGTDPTAKGDKGTYYALELKGDAPLMDDAKYRLALIVQPGTAGQTIKMMSNGDDNIEPCFDAPTAGGYDFSANGYTKGNSDFTASVFASNDAVISVGAFITRNTFKDWNGKDRYYLASKVTGQVQEIGEIVDFSSYGIDDNGKPRPTLIAPGQGIISGTNNYNYTDYFVKDSPGEPDTQKSLTTLIGSVELNGRKSWYHVEQGTSMSCPHVAGIVALWMQAKPSLTANEILSVMKETCINDKYTTDPSKIPSGNTVQTGYGKIDCLAGLKKILGTTAIERIIADENQMAPSELKAVDAPVFDLKGQQVPKSQKGVVIYKGRKYVNK